MRAPLANEDAAAGDQLAAKTLDAEALPLRIAPVRRRSAALLVRHENLEAICVLRELNVDFNGRSILPVPTLNLVLAAALEFQYLHFGTAKVLDDRAGHLRLGRVLTTQKLWVVGANCQDFVEPHFSADLALDPLDLDRFAWCDAVLFAPTTNYSVHAASQLG
jgi:hypothetical protein